MCAIRQQRAVWTSTFTFPQIRNQATNEYAPGMDLEEFVESVQFL